VPTVKVFVEVIGGGKMLADIDPGVTVEETAGVIAELAGKSLVDDDGKPRNWRLFAPKPDGGFGPAERSLRLIGVAGRMKRAYDSGDDMGFAGPGEFEGGKYLFKLRLFVPGAPPKPPPRQEKEDTFADEEAIDLTNIDDFDTDTKRKKRKKRKKPIDGESSTVRRRKKKDGDADSSTIRRRRKKKEGEGDPDGSTIRRKKRRAQDPDGSTVRRRRKKKKKSGDADEAAEDSAETATATDAARGAPAAPPEAEPAQTDTEAPKPAPLKTEEPEAQEPKAQEPEAQEAQEPKAQEPEEPKAQEPEEPKAQEAQEPEAQEPEEPKAQEAEEPKPREPEAEEPEPEASPEEKPSEEEAREEETPKAEEPEPAPAQATFKSSRERMLSIKALEGEGPKPGDAAMTGPHPVRVQPKKFERPPDDELPPATRTGAPAEPEPEPEPPAVKPKAPPKSEPKADAETQAAPEEPSSDPPKPKKSGGKGLMIGLAAIVVVGAIAAVVMRPGGDPDPTPAPTPTATATPAPTTPKTMSDKVTLRAYTTGEGTEGDPVDAAVKAWAGLGATAAVDLTSKLAEVETISSGLAKTCRAGGRFDACDAWAWTAFSAHRACAAGGEGCDQASLLAESRDAIGRAYSAAQKLSGAAKGAATKRLLAQSVRIGGADFPALKKEAAPVAALAKKACGMLKDKPECATIE
jgi:hypothetical protein